MSCRQLFLQFVLLSATFWYTESTPSKEVATNNPGFISIDCGAGQDYVDPETRISYKSDREFISTGENQEISPEYDEEIPYYGRQLKNLRYFPKGRKNCYRLRPEQGKNHKYLVRLYFKYGNYDSRSDSPVFVVYLGVNLVALVNFRNQTDWPCWETIYYSTSDTIDVCLVNFGSGTPFISALELRFVHDSSYRNMSGPLNAVFRGDYGKPQLLHVRYKDDVYDRMWSTDNFPGCISVNTTSDIIIDSTANFYSQQLPPQVWSTASQPSHPLRSLILPPTAACGGARCYFCIYFCEILNTTSNPKIREFYIIINNVSYGSITLQYLKPFSLCQPFQEPLQISLISTNQSQLPPLINAVELFVVVPSPNSPTHPTDMEGMSSIMESYNIHRDEWQGDPCVPSDLSWNSLNCSYDTIPPRIISLDLSSSKLKGNISSSFSILKGLKYLDLSNNELTGTVPDFFAQLPNLSVLNFSGNKLTGPIPQSLVEKSSNGILQLSLAGNPNICEPADSCVKKPKRSTNFVIPLTTSVIGVLILLLLISLFILWRKQSQDAKSKNEGAGLAKNHYLFSFADIVRITDDFKTIIGEGGFGKVYLGILIDNDSQLVAVKLLSQFSRQGYKEFQAEAQLLMIVHHRNLVSLIGYCDDHNNKALIYEYMANGNLREHLLGTIGFILSWEERLEIAVDAAQGLEYLHNGCKPPVVHRDLKTSNILLNERFQAKISDFGLSRAFPAESDSHITTTPAGTYGYMAPEAQASGNFNKKSDVYAFGIIILELITGLPAIRRDAAEGVVRIQNWAISILEGGDIRSVIDPKLQGKYEANSAWKGAEIALACANDVPTDRPDMSIVLVALKECLALAMPAAGSDQRMERGQTRSRNPLEIRSLEINSEMVPSPR